MPYLAGFYADTYEAAGVQIQFSAEPVVKKLLDVGYPIIARELAKHHGLEFEAGVKKRRSDLDDGPGM